MLHDPTPDGGMGFCHDALPSVLPWGYHGPLVVALDSNILIDLREHGERLLGGGAPEGLDSGYAADLDGLADILNLWLLRDIRLIVTPRSLTDAKKVTEQFLDRQLPAVQAIATSLAFQFGDWTVPAPSSRPVRIVGDETGLPNGADCELVLEAQGIGAHVFLTRDRQVLERVALTGPNLVVAPPAWVSSELREAGVQPFFGGTCGRDRCPYDDWSMPAPDMGKWAGLLSALGGED